MNFLHIYSYSHIRKKLDKFMHVGIYNDKLDAHEQVNHIKISPNKLHFSPKCHSM